MGINERLAEQYGLTIYESDAPDRKPVDFSVYSSYDGDNMAWVWGDADDYEVECNHEVEWGDDDELGYCVVCGKECSWHWENQVVNEGKDEDGNYYCQTAGVREIDDWHEGDGGIIKQYVKEKYGQQN